ncbi:dTMP kinase, partial [Streptomyces mutabilis]
TQRTAEEAHRRAEVARRAAEQAAAAAAAGPKPTAPPAADAPRPAPPAPHHSDAATVPTPIVTPTNASGGPVEDTAVLRPVRDPQDSHGDAGEDGARDSGAPGESESEVTAELPKPPAPAGAADETAVLPAVEPRAEDETAVLPPVTPSAADSPSAAEETAVLPPVRAEDPADRVPSDYFRKEDPAAGSDRSPEPQDRTRELPRVDPDQAPPRRRRSDWAEETPLDDLPTLADELLGPRDGDGPEADGRGDGGRRGKGGRGRR